MRKTLFLLSVTALLIPISSSVSARYAGAQSIGHPMFLTLRAPCEVPVNSTVWLVGSFNDWSHVAHRMEFNADDGAFIKRMILDHGRHEYKFRVVTSEGLEFWINDPRNPYVTDSGVGTANNVLFVPPLPDGYVPIGFELFSFTLGDFEWANVVGCFNDWQQGQFNMVRRPSGRGYYLIIEADRPFQYKFVADNTWWTDYSNPNTVPNLVGSHNSIRLPAATQSLSDELLGRERAAWDDVSVRRAAQLVLDKEFEIFSLSQPSSASPFIDRVIEALRHESASITAQNVLGVVDELSFRHDESTVMFLRGEVFDRFGDTKNAYLSRLQLISTLSRDGNSELFWRTTNQLADYEMFIKMRPSLALDRFTHLVEVFGSDPDHLIPSLYGVVRARHISRDFQGSIRAIDQILSITDNGSALSCEGLRMVVANSLLVAAYSATALRDNDLARHYLHLIGEISPWHDSSAIRLGYLLEDVIHLRESRASVARNGE